MSFLFGKRKTPEEMLRQNQRALQKVIRELEKERTALERQEKKLITDIKKMAKSGQMDAVKIMAKDLVRTRAFIKKFILMKANIQGISLKIQTLKSQASMATAMKGVTKALKRMNSKINLPNLQKIMMEFERESEIMDIKEETMTDTMDDVLGEGDEEEETEVIVSQVLDELGISLDQELSGITPGLERPHISTDTTKQKVVAGAETDDLQARLDNLKRGDDD
ncbi:PREDICTED: charged multivesicular body protein 2a-like [Amphimedon queenslandica]|uniref:Charged multivesicular body protein 2a n=1 Tax=Amphimedon queenslandica TaxID=400682 RepID=A0A1X7VEZ1_AMPQE|nr:PREDICTED: charged multivesicular body protein 2a-like [Amphimedon queenslandica]|eukprot:XP_003384449.1 PREDICTED: charged multivesicular body protein 2a-like [Amphimedon queenslandica]